jgi:hypothetical protein
MKSYVVAAPPGMKPGEVALFSFAVAVSDESMTPNYLIYIKEGIIRLEDLLSVL